MFAYDSLDSLGLDSVFSMSAAYASLPQIAPELENPGPQTVAHGAVDGIVNLMATDANNDPITYSATTQSLEYYWDQQLGLSPAPLSMYLNWGGLHEKWFTGSNQPYFYITPDGTLYQWLGDALNQDKPLAHFNSNVYESPSLLYNAQNTIYASLSLSGNALSIDSYDDFVGTFVVTVSASDGLGGTDLESFMMTVSGPISDTVPPTLIETTPSPNATINSTNASLEIRFSESVSNLDATDLKLAGTSAGSASVGVPVSLGNNAWRFPVYNLSSGNLFVTLAPDAGDIEDVNGNDFQSVTWNYIVNVMGTPHAPIINPVDNRTLTNGYSNLVITLNGMDPDNDPLHFSGSVMTIEAYTDQRFKLSFSGNYYLNAGGLQEKWLLGENGWYYILPNGRLYHWLGGDSENAVFLEQLSTAAYEEPSLLYHASLVNNVATLNFAGNTLTINPADQFSGRFAVTVTASDGHGGSDTKSFLVDVGPASFRNGRPQVVSISPSENEVIRGSETFLDIVFSEPVIRVDSSDIAVSGISASHARIGPAILIDALTWRFTITNLTDGHLSVSIGSEEHSIQDFEMEDLVPITSNYEVVLAASDQAPVLDSIGSRVIPASPSITSIFLSATDVNDDPLTWTANVQSEAYYWDQLLSLSFNGNLYLNFGGKNEKWLMGAENCWYYLTPAGELYRWKGSSTLVGDEFMGQLASQIYENIEQLYEATNAQPANVVIQNDGMNVAPQLGFSGTFYVVVRVADGSGHSDSEAVKFTVMD